MINNYQDNVAYLGTGTLATYTFPYKIRSKDQVLVLVLDNALQTLVFSQTADIVNANVVSSTFDAVNGGGSITLAANLPATQTLILKLAMDGNKQEFQFREQNDFKIRSIENALDALTTFVQRLYEKTSRALTFDEIASFKPGLNTKISKLPVPKGVPIMDITGTQLEMIDLATLLGGGTLPAGGLVEQVLGHDGTNPIWQQYAFSGYSNRFGAPFNSTDLKDTILKILDMGYAAPLIALSGSANFLREKGAVVASIVLTSTVTKNSNDLARIKVQQGASVLADLNPPASVLSQVVTTPYAIPFSDTISFSADVTDILGPMGGPVTVTSNITYPFVYPYYFGSGPFGLTPAQVAALTKSIIPNSAAVSKTFTPASGETFYFAYPSAYPVLTQIVDPFNFDNIPDWTVSTIMITGLDATAQSYRLYRFNNPVTPATYTYNFKS